MKTLLTVLSLSALATVAAVADAQNAGLALEVRARIYPLSSFSTVPDRVLVVECALRNLGTVPLTIPTQTEKGRPTVAVRHPKQEFIAHSISIPVVGGHGEEVSQIAFHPVTLEPGEAAKLPTYVAREKGAALAFPPEVRVVYEVNSEVAEHYGWWRGELDVAAKVEVNEEAQPGATDNPGDAQ